MNGRWLLALPGALFLVYCSHSSSTPPGSDQPGMGGPTAGDIVGQIDPSTVQTKLPLLPRLTNVAATQREDSEGIDFDPFDGAVDYRVYPLPSDADITVNSDGTNTVKNAIYRCSGVRQTWDVANNQNSMDTGDGGIVTSGKYAWGTQIGSDPNLGYVYTEAAAGRIPVYAVAGFPTTSEEGWREARLKLYTTDATERQMLLAQNWRDDGIVFYVPATASASTHTVFASQVAGVVAGQGWTKHTQYYLLQADVAAHAKDTTPPAPAFQALNATADGAVPLMTVTYQTSQPHMELAAGNDRYQRAANQGNGPLWHLEWADLTAPTTLVVEALASGCPYQGFLSPQHLDAPPHQTFYTLAELQAKSTTGEVFVNGQADTTTMPKAVARSFVKVVPMPHKASDWDWYQGFGDEPVAVATDAGLEGGAEGGVAGGVKEIPGCKDYHCNRWQSSIFDFSMYRIDEPNGVPVFTYGTTLGQFWEAFDDSGSDLTGKVRFTALQKANVDATTFMHATMSVDIVATDRRYPQLIISDQPAPVLEGMSNPDNNTLLVQPIIGPSMRIEAQAIHGLVGSTPWDVDNQAPEHRFIDDNSSTTNNNVPQSPTEPPFEHAGMDRMTKFDVYVSSTRMYLFFDNAPAGCTQFPSNFALKGPVTVTFGDVLYHEGAVDELVCSQDKPYSFMHRHQCTETKRHFDDLGFKSGVPAPAWDETSMPCGPY